MEKIRTISSVLLPESVTPSASVWISPEVCPVTILFNLKLLILRYTLFVFSRYLRSDEYIHGGVGGIRTHVPVKTTRFRVELVMTTSIRLRTTGLYHIFLDLRIWYTCRMVNLLIKHFVKEDNKNQVGKVCGFLGIFFNTLLFLLKYTIGAIVHSVSIQADAINNLTDAVSNILSILSFHWTNKPADRNHPFGHERTEAISSFLIALITAYLGVELLKQSVEKIIDPSETTFRWATIVILLLSIGIKFYMYMYNHRLSIQYQSDLLAATALDSLSDVWGTTGVFISMILSQIIGFNLDGYVGVAVSILILYNAYKLLREEIDTLLGKAPDTDMVEQLRDQILESELVLGVHDIVIHQYGADNIFASAHVEVDAASDIWAVHDEIDNIEHKIKESMNLELVLHMDPIKVNDPQTNLYKEKLKQAIKEIGEPWSFHDFRIVPGPTHTNLVFDLLVPYECEYSQSEIEEKIKEHIHSEKPVYLVITIDHPMI